MATDISVRTFYKEGLVSVGVKCRGGPSGFQFPKLFEITVRTVMSSHMKGIGVGDKRMFSGEGTREEVSKLRAHGCGSISPDMIFYKIPVVISAN